MRRRQESNDWAFANFWAAWADLRERFLTTHIYNDTVFLITFMNGDVCGCRCISLFVPCNACVRSTVSNGNGGADYDRFADNVTVSIFWLIDEDVTLLRYFLDSTVFPSFIPRQRRQRSSRSSTRQFYVRLLRIKRFRWKVSRDVWRPLF